MPRPGQPTKYPSIDKVNLKREDLLNLKLIDWNLNSNKGYKSNEKYLTDFIDTFLPQLLRSKELLYQNIAKEFNVHFFRLDYLIKLISGDFIIIEVKHSNQERDFVGGIGQLLAYRTMLSVEYAIPIEKIKLYLFINQDSPITLSTILDCCLPIDVFIVGKNGIKYYGKT